MKEEKNRGKEGRREEGERKWGGGGKREEKEAEEAMKERLPGKRAAQPSSPVCLQ